MKHPSKDNRAVSSDRAEHLTFNQVLYVIPLETSNPSILSFAPKRGFNEIIGGNTRVRD